MFVPAYISAAQAKNLHRSDEIELVAQLLSHEEGFLPLSGGYRLFVVRDQGSKPRFLG
jgi:hypothetical protein